MHNFHIVANKNSYYFMTRFALVSLSWNSCNCQFAAALFSKLKSIIPIARGKNTSIPSQVLPNNGPQTITPCMQNVQSDVDLKTAPKTLGDTGDQSLCSRRLQAAEYHCQSELFDHTDGCRTEASE